MIADGYLMVIVGLCGYVWVSMLSIVILHTKIAAPDRLSNQSVHMGLIKTVENYTMLISCIYF